MAELRYKGNLVQYFTVKEDAQSYLDARAKNEAGHVPSDWTIEADRLVQLFCRGALIETFNTVAEAEAERDKRISELSQLKKPSIARFMPTSTFDWSINSK